MNDSRGEVHGRKWGEAKDGGNDVISKKLEIIFKSTLLLVKNHSSMGYFFQVAREEPAVEETYVLHTGSED